MEQSTRRATPGGSLESAARVSEEAESSDNLVAFQIPAELMAQAEAALQAVRADPAAEESRGALVEIVLELTDRGMDFYYLEPLRRARVGAMATSATRLGIAAAGRGIPPIVRRVISSLDDEQVLGVADFVDEILIRERRD